jgi:hypothetical protein
MRLGLAGCLALAAVLAATLLGAAAPQQASALRTGVFDGEIYYADEPAAYSKTKRSGARFAKVLMRWYEVAPGGGGPSSLPGGAPGGDLTDPSNPAYNWGAYDRFVIGAVRRGLQPVIAIHGTPTWAKASSGCNANVSCVPVAARFGQFARAAATRYDGSHGFPRVRFWQAWSEPNLDFFMVPPSPTVYRRMLGEFTAGVRAGNPSARVIGGGLAPLARKGAAVGPLAFMRKLLCMKGRKRPRKACGARAAFDIWSTHPYTTGGPTHSGPGPDDVSLGDLPQMTRLLRAADKSGRIQSRYRRVPFWVTEFSWDTRPPDPGGVPLGRHARWVAEALYRMQSAGVSTVIWFGLRDQRRGRDYAETYQSGLYRRAKTVARDKPKPALRAFRFPFVSLPAGRRKVRVWGRTPTGKGGRVILQARYRRGGWRKVGRLRARGSGEFTKVLRGRRPAKMRAVFRKQKSLAFGVHRTRDIYQPPFGGNPRATRAASPRLLPGAGQLYRALTEAAP